MAILSTLISQHPRPFDRFIGEQAITGTYQRQIWDRDYAVNVGDPITFDAAAILAEMSAEDVVELLEHGDASTVCDCHFGGAVEWDGPFEVGVVDELRSWLERDGLDPLDVDAVASRWPTLQQLLQALIERQQPAPIVLTPPAQAIFDLVVAGMQSAKGAHEIGDDDYLLLMRRIANEAMRRVAIESLRHECAPSESR